MLYLIQSAQDNVRFTMAQLPIESVMALAKANLLMDLHFDDIYWGRRTGRGTSPSLWEVNEQGCAHGSQGVHGRVVSAC